MEGRAGDWSSGAKHRERKGVNLRSADRMMCSNTETEADSAAGLFLRCAVLKPSHKWK